MISQNQKVGSPYGDIFFVNTPSLDRVANTLYLENKQRQAKLANDAAALNDEFSRNAAKIRDADVPELSKKWNDYKQSWINLQKIKPNSPDRIQREMDLQRSKIDMYGLINKSAEGKAIEEEDAKDYIKNPDRYQQSARDILSLRRKTPIIHPDYDALREAAFWKLGTTDFSKDFNNATGKAGMIGKSEPIPVSNGLEWQTSTYRGLPKTAPQIAESFLGSVVGSQKASDLIREHPELNDPLTLKSIDEQYDALVNSDLYKKAYKGKKIDFPEWMNQTPQGKIAVYLAKQAAINNPPSEEKDKPYANYEAQLKQKNAENDRRSLRDFTESEKLIALNRQNNRPPDEGIQHPMAKNAANHSFTVYENGVPKTYIRLRDISGIDMATINPFDASQLIYPAKPKIIKTADGKDDQVFEIDTKSGDWLGEGDKRIDYKAVGVNFGQKISTDKKAGLINTINSNKPKTQGTKTPVFKMN